MKKLYVGGLPWEVDNDQLAEIFTKFGPLVEDDGAVVIKDPFRGYRSKGFGFVSFQNDEDAEKAIAELNESELGGRTLVVNEAQPKGERTDRDNE